MNLNFYWKSWNATGEHLHTTAQEMIESIDYHQIGFLIIELYNPIQDQFQIIDLSIDFKTMNIDSPPNGINIDDQIGELITALRGKKNVLYRAKNNKGSN